jgi:hypothetical protein
MIYNREQFDEPPTVELDSSDWFELKEIFRDHAEFSGRYPDENEQERIIEEYVYEQLSPDYGDRYGL